MKKFEIPGYYKSSVLAGIKESRKLAEGQKKDFSPSLLDFGQVQFLIARHFGFCYGVENAIEIAYRTIEENPEKKIFLLSEMIHNPSVNLDLQSRGVRFIMDPAGNQLIDWDKIDEKDIVLIPAFGTTLPVEDLLLGKGIDIKKYNTTCPFVEKVWNKAAVLGRNGYTIIIHGKSKHEETRATFSRSTQKAESLIIKNLEEAVLLSKIISGEYETEQFYSLFAGKFSEGFNAEIHLNRIGVVNQTTMLAAETEAISSLLRDTVEKKFGGGNIKKHFADTRDTLCYATNDNQQATIELSYNAADLALVVGGYNSSNTSHIVELLEKKYKTYFISDSDKIISKALISHYDISFRKELITSNYLPSKEKITIALTSGASCPDSIVEDVLNKILSFYK